MRLLFLLVLLQAVPALAQEEPESVPEGEIAPSQHPGSDSPEAVHGKYEGPKRRVQAFLIPMDEGARTPTTRVGQAVEAVLLHTSRYEVVDLGRALSVESTAEQALSADAGRALLKEGNAAAASKGWPEAAAKYQRAVQEFDKGLPAVGPREYADAVLRLATATFMGGEDKPAADLFALAVRLDPQRKLVADEAAAPQLEQARAQLTGAKRCSLEMDVRPAGARVFVDGELRGQHVEVPAGKHLVKVERAGFYPYAEVLDLSPRRPTKASITLAATPTAASLNQIIAGASDEVGRGAAGKNVAALAQKFSLDRVLVGSVRSAEEAKMSITLALVDEGAHRLVGVKSLLATADGTDADQIEADVTAAVNKLVSQDAEESTTATDKPAAAAAEKPAAEAPKAATESARKPVMPGAAEKPAPSPTADDPGLVSHERKVAVPASATAADSKEPVAKEAPAPASKQENKTKKKKDKSKGIQGKTGTEDWDTDD